MTRDRVDYAPSQEVAAEFPEVPAEAFARSVQLFEPDGRRWDRAAAVFRSLGQTSRLARLAAGMHARGRVFAAVTDAAYDVVARRRGVFSTLTRWLWGRRVEPPTFAVGTMLFLRLLGLVYAAAFVSFGAQAPGLVGENGILPVRQFLAAVGADAWGQAPTLLWLGAADGALRGLAVAGGACAALIMLGVAQPLALLGAWAAYLSLVVAGQDFYAFQWDGLLLEAGLLAIFVAPWRARPNLAAVNPHRLARFLLVWLLFRMMLSSGAVKLARGDPAWRDLTALEFHFFTQPLPNVVAWFAAQAPAWADRLGAAAMFGVELGLPFLVFLPRRPRHLAALGFLALQGAIALTGNYGFFNLLTAALALILIDDAAWSRLIGRRPAAVPMRGPRWALAPFAAIYLALSLLPLAGSFGSFPAVLRPLVPAWEVVAPFRSVNAYGLFAVMTRERPEIRLQGSRDGREWRDYVFRFKPGPLDRPPPFAGLHLPRLDWQMWFAALRGDPAGTPWMGPFVARLLEGRPEVLALLAENPFPGEPPRFVRADLDDYRFTTFAERQESGDWWQREPRAIYFGPVSREDLR